MYEINHWIPAFACLLQAGRNDEMLVETAVVISVCLRQAAMMIKTKVTAMRLSSRLSKARQARRNEALSLLFTLPLFNIIIVHQYPMGLSLGVVELAGVDRPVERGREEGDEAERDQDQ